MERMVKEVDHDTITVKSFTSLLSRELGGIDLSHKSKFIKKTLTDILNSMEEEQSEAEEEDESEDEEEDEVPTKKRAKRGGGGGGGGLAARKEVSDELAAFLGKGKYMARTEVVKELWNYIRENNLQNPENRREILLDDRMKQVFGVNKFTMFSMNKYIGAHIDPFKPVDLTSNSTPPAAGKKRKKTSSKKDGKKRKSGTQAPYQLSPELARVTGKQILPRPQVTKALWVYIRQNNLQVSLGLYCCKKLFVLLAFLVPLTQCSRFFCLVEPGG
jgi:upstream activation factor subunit UAF30